MIIDVYRSAKDSTKFLSVPHGTDPQTVSYPDDLDPALNTIVPFRDQMDINPNDKRIAMDSADIIKQITDNGFATHRAFIVIKEG